MTRDYDEPFTLYGLLARTVETNDVRSYVTFALNPAARFSDGTAVTADDVVFSWQLLRDHGRPNHRTYYSKVAKAEILDPLTIRFDFADGSDRELPLILGLMPVLPKHAVDVASFEKTTLAKPIGSGPYVVDKVDVGKSVSLKRNPNYWGQKLPINRGLWNFDEVRFDFFRDGNAYFEAFKAGLYDVRSETDPTRWQTGYDFPAVRDGRVVKEAIANGLPKFASDYVFNTRRPIFADIRVRQAIALLFDFQWVNRNFFFNLYTRSASFFDDSELSAYHRPADERERALLAPYPDAVRPDVLDGTWSPPVTDGSDRDRDTLRQALELFKAAGYELKGTTLQDRATGRPFAFEIMVTSRDDERLALAFSNQLARAGITVQVRLVDAVQYDQRLASFDFDMIEYRWDQSLSPGNEQAFYWGSAAADQQGTRNYMGVRSAAVDAMIAAMLRARQRPDFVAAVRALDRVLISGSYVVPLFYLPEPMGGALGLYCASDADLAVRLSAGNLVAQAAAGAAMIPGDPTTTITPQHGSRISIDELFRRVAERRPDAIALADAPNRELFTDGPPRRLTFAEADRMVSAIAGRLCRMGLPIDTVVGVQLPNIVENVLTILGVLRAGMIAAPMPLLWRSADAVTAMARVGAKALITCGRVGGFEHCRLATRVAADVFSIRYVCGFGDNLSDGVVPLHDLFTAEKLDPIPLLDRNGHAAAHLAVINFESGEDGPVPVARRHLELLAGGMCVLSEGRFQPHGSMLSTIAPASFAGISLTLVPWLLTGGTLAPASRLRCRPVRGAAARRALRHADLAGPRGLSLCRYRAVRK